MMYSGFGPHISKSVEGAAGRSEPDPHVDQHCLPQVLRGRPATAAATTLQWIQGVNDLSKSSSKARNLKLTLSLTRIMTVTLQKICFANVLIGSKRRAIRFADLASWPRGQVHATFLTIPVYARNRRDDDILSFLRFISNKWSNHYTYIRH